MEPEKEIQELRKAIDDLDREIVRLLQRRFDAVKRIGKVKKALGVAVEDSEREKEVLRNFLGAAKGVLEEDFIKKLTKLVLEYSKKIQGGLK